MPRLTDDDGRAVDRLLDCPVDCDTVDDTPPAAGQVQFHQRLARIEQLLGLLKVMPPVDLPHGLLTRLLDSIDDSAQASTSRLAMTDSESSVSTQPYL